MERSYANADTSRSACTLRIRKEFIEKALHSGTEHESLHITGSKGFTIRSVELILL
jgi:hypothetical protein